MLTDKQIKEFNELIPTIINNNYKKLVTEAVANWRVTIKKPTIGRLGIKIGIDATCVENDDGPGCCLLGAFNINKKLVEDEGFYPHYELLSVDESYVVIKTFDKGSGSLGRMHISEYSELISLIQKVRNIALEK